MGGLCGPPRPLCQALRPCSRLQPCALQVSKSACVLTTQAIMRLLKSKDAAAAVDVRTWPTILDTGAHPRLRRCVCWPPGHTAFPFFVVRIVLLPPDNKSRVRAADIAAEGPLATGPPAAHSGSPSWQDPCTRGAESLLEACVPTDHPSSRATHASTAVGPSAHTPRSFVPSLVNAAYPMKCLWANREGL